MRTDLYWNGSTVKEEEGGGPVKGNWSILCTG